MGKEVLRAEVASSERRRFWWRREERIWGVAEIERLPESSGMWKHGSMRRVKMGKRYRQGKVISLFDSDRRGPPSGKGKEGGKGGTVLR